VPNKRAIRTCHYIIATRLFHYINGHCFKFALSRKKCANHAKFGYFICIFDKDIRVNAIKLRPVEDKSFYGHEGLEFLSCNIFVSRFQESNSGSREFESSRNLNNKKNLENLRTEAFSAEDLVFVSSRSLKSRGKYAEDLVFVSSRSLKSRGKYTKDLVFVSSRSLKSRGKYTN
jgi:hypothetical protein